jgi:acetoin utilization deacetylase AcuC-like enzyme
MSKPRGGSPARLLIGFVLTIVLAGEARTGYAAADAPRGLKTGFLYGDIYLKHQTGAGHPERPERLTAIVERLKQKGLLNELVALKPVPASTEWIHTVHTQEYIERVRKDCQVGTGYVDSPDSPASADSYQVALNAVGGVQAAIDAVMEGKIQNAFCIMR